MKLHILHHTKSSTKKSFINSFAFLIGGLFIALSYPAVATVLGFIRYRIRKKKYTDDDDPCENIKH